MKVFVTGATGFIGSRVVPELLKKGHQVLGLTRSDEGAKKLEAQGATVHRGTLEDPQSLRAGAEKADGVIHCAFDHDFSNFVANCEKDRTVITAMADVLTGSDRPFVITSGVGLGSRGHGLLAIESVFDDAHKNPRIASEYAGQDALQRGVNVSVMRLPQVHDTVKQGLITPLIEHARAKGLLAYIGEGNNNWSAAHVTDVARLYVLALERAVSGSRYNAVAEETIPMRTIAETLAQVLNLPVKSLSPSEAAEHFGWLNIFAGLDMGASSEWTRKTLSWSPTGPDLITDLKNLNQA